MDIAELREACQRMDPLTGEPVKHIYLTVPTRYVPNGSNIRLGGKVGPFGKICDVKAVEGSDGYFVVAVFKTAKILKAIENEV